jgi:hypothetical protein
MSNVIDLPGDVKKGDPVKAEDYNKLLAALRSSIIQPGTGYLRSINKSGTTLRIQQNKEFRPRINPAFSVIEVDSDGGNDYNLRLEPGRVCSANPVAAADSPPEDGYDYFMPEINGTPMDQKDANGDYPQISVEDGFSIYCKIKRSATGIVIPPVQIVAADREEKSGHYFPPDPFDSGTEEVFQYRRLIDLDVVSDEVEIKVWRRSDIDLEPFLWKGDNLGTGVDVFKEHNEQDGVYNFRRINACYGLEGELNGDSVKLDFEAENIGDTYTGTKANVYVEYDGDSCGQKAQFRPITQGAETDRQQIEIEQDGEVVRVKGNDVKKTIELQDCEGNELLSLEFEDGLLKDAGDEGSVLIQIPPCGSNYNGGGTDPGSTGSDKSTAIVPMGWHEKGYGALFTMESNEVLFDFVIRNVAINGAISKAQIDDRFLSVCEPGSIVVTGVTGDKLGPVSAVVKGDQIVLTALPISFLRPNEVTLRLTGTRKGFEGFDMPERSERQFIANEKFINSAYPRD